MNICTEISFNNEQINKMGGFEEDEKKFHAHFIEKDEKLFCKLYFRKGSTFHVSLGNWIVSNQHIDLFSLAKIESINEKEKVKKIYINHSRQIGYKMGTSQYTNGTPYVLIEIDQIIYELDTEEWILQEHKSNFAELFLNVGSTKLVRDFYAFLSFVTEENQWNAESRWDNFVELTEFAVKLKYLFESNSDQTETVIRHLPIIEIKHNCTQFEEFNFIIKFMEEIITFFCNQNVEFEYSRIYFKDKKVVIRRTKNINLRNVTNAKIYHLDYNKDFMHFLSDLDFRKVRELEDDILSILGKYNFLKSLKGESQFMICYSILENIRNILLKKYKIKEEFSFINSRKDSSEFIRDRLQEISVIIDLKEKEKFKNHSENHIKTIKYLPMSTQLTQLFTTAKLVPPENLDLIVKIRNNIFHGSKPKITEEELNKVNIDFKNYIGKLILKLCGI